MRNLKTQRVTRSLIYTYHDQCSTGVEIYSDGWLVQYGRKTKDHYNGSETYIFNITREGFDVFGYWVVPINEIRRIYYHTMGYTDLNDERVKEFMRGH